MPLDRRPPPQSEAKRSRGRPKVRADAAQADLIVEGASELFLQQGYAATTMDEVAARCRVSKRTLYRLFPSKPDLFVGVVDAHRRTMLALPTDDDDPSLESVLERIFRIDIDEAEDRRRMGLVRLMMVETRQFPEIAHAFREHGPQAAEQLLADWLDRQRAAGRLAFDDSRLTAAMLLGMVFGGLVPRPDLHDEWSLAQRKDYVRGCIRVFLDGVRAA